MLRSGGQIDVQCVQRQQTFGLRKHAHGIIARQEGDGVVDPPARLNFPSTTPSPSSYTWWDPGEHCYCFDILATRPRSERVGMLTMGVFFFPPCIRLPLGHTCREVGAFPASCCIDLAPRLASRRTALKACALLPTTLARLAWLTQARKRG